jgi:hypothetical protein
MPQSQLYDVFLSTSIQDYLRTRVYVDMIEPWKRMISHPAACSFELMTTRIPIESDVMDNHWTE